MVFRSAVLFFLAGLAEIGGGYFVWIWLRYDAGIIWGVLGGLVLILNEYQVATASPSHENICLV